MGPIYQRLHLPSFNVSHDVFPSTMTTYLSTALLVLSLCIGVVIIKFPTLPTVGIFMGLLFLFALFILGSFVLDVNVKLKHKATKRSSNMMSTVLTSFITLCALPVLYRVIWYSDLNTSSVILTEDFVDSIQFPSMALFQRSDWSSQANLLVPPSPKCFLGWQNETAPKCSSVSPGTVCSCGENWDSSLVHGFEWKDVQYNMLSFQSSEYLMSTKPTFLMIAQAYFNYNATRAKDDSSRASSPGLWVAFYDPLLDIQQALESENTQMHLIAANAEVAVNLGIKRNQDEGGASYYDYDLAISAVQTSDLVCDVDTTGNYPCYVSLLIQFPTFGRQTFSTESLQGWKDVVAEAGSWFSFFQIIGWVFSGLSVEQG